jgi:hypothetical protein
MTNSLSIKQKNSLLLENHLYSGGNNYSSSANPQQQQGFSSYLNPAKLAASLSDPNLITFKNPNPLMSNLNINPPLNHNPKSSFQKPSYIQKYQDLGLGLNLSN